MTARVTRVNLASPMVMFSTQVQSQVQCAHVFKFPVGYTVQIKGQIRLAVVESYKADWGIVKYICSFKTQKGAKLQRKVLEDQVVPFPSVKALQISSSQCTKPMFKFELYLCAQTSKRS